MGWSEEVRDKDGKLVAIACGRGRRRSACDTPGCKRDHVALCDFPVVRNGKKGTCDRRMCAGHKHAIGPNRDLCGPHFRAEGEP